MAEERVRQREDLLRASEAAFAKLADKIAHRRGPKGKDKIGRALGRIENRYKLAKHFDIAIGDEGFTFHRNQARIAEEARLDGFYVIRTSVEGTTLAADNVVGAYKSLARVERAFRSLKTVDLHLRPIHHWLAPRSAPTSFSAGSPAMSNGTCASVSNPCCLMMTTLPPQPANAPLPTPLYCRHSPTRAGRSEQTRQQNHPRRHSGAQLPEPVARPRHLHPQRDDDHSQQRLHLYLGDHPDTRPRPGLHPTRHRPRPTVASNAPALRDYCPVRSNPCV